MNKTINLTLKVWRQKSRDEKGRFETYPAQGISTDMSFLEMLDVVNEKLTVEGKEPIAFEHDCREGICGSCGSMVNGRAHGPLKGTSLCQLHMRHFKNGDTLVIEPWRARAFPVIKDLVVDRSALDRIMDAAACIGCGACVAACPNASAMLFVSAKVSQFALLPQGRPEADRRALGMVRAMDACGFGNCSNHRECENAPQGGLDREHRAPEPGIPSRRVRFTRKVTKGQGSRSWCLVLVFGVWCFVFGVWEDAGVRGVGFGSG